MGEARGMVGDIEKMIAVGLVWGATNAIMRRGALIWDHALKSSSSSKPPRHCTTLPQRCLFSLGNWLKLLSIWQYTIPFLINLSASATFFAILSDAPISLVVPVTNATTFAATAVFGMLLGEETHVPRALYGRLLPRILVRIVHPEKNLIPILLLVIRYILNSFPSIMMKYSL
ncbi:uncharacterized protein LOC129292938 isoform X3 [Prosopis cineraria]|uniref:uncharacterized protein LOC129292938 isoform X3 n=1 Tax=Prosopis cineraria TaxID=364024 RepID=UPI00240F8964|nr:uncharacterized protein LOC129292938 isoform X3 [Prosopis cineraria]